MGLVKTLTRLLHFAVITAPMALDLAGQPTPTYRLERLPVPGGAELVTLIRHNNGSDARSSDVPMLTILRDTLGDRDPENDRLRYVWILTKARPNVLQSVTSAIPFAFFRTGTKGHSSHPPRPMLDLASPNQSVWTNVLGDTMQVLRLDPMGAWVRSPSRAYRGNAADYRKLQVFQALSALNRLFRDEPNGQSLLSWTDLRKIYSRLMLSNRTLGGLVREESLAQFYANELSQQQQIRSRNWELLRQRAELCGLYFDPIPDGAGVPGTALLWIARSDLEDGKSHECDTQFLSVKNPWTDDRLLKWTGYSQAFYFDSDNRSAPSETPGAHVEDLIPLAFYTLDHPRVPFMLVDFRDPGQPKRREMVFRGASTITTSVLGLTRFGNWSFLAASWAWTFIRERHGVAVSHTARLRAYSETREFLAADASFDPALKNDLVQRLDHFSLNPLENCLENEASLARQQYSALLQYATSPAGLAAKLNRDRKREMESDTRSKLARLLAAPTRWFTGRHATGVYRESSLVAHLDASRRVAHHLRFLRSVLASGPFPEVTWDTAEIRRSIDVLADEPKAAGPAAARVIANLLLQTEDGQLRRSCLWALGYSDLIYARGELKRLSEDPNATDMLRALCLVYLNGGVEDMISSEAGTR